MDHSKLHFQQITFTKLFQAETLQQLDQQFLTYLNNYDNSLHAQLLAYRKADLTYSPTQASELLLACAPILEQFLTDFFDIQIALAKARQAIRQYDSIFAFKKWLVLRRAKRRLHQPISLEQFAKLNEWLIQALGTDTDDRTNLTDQPEKLITELAVAQLAQHYLTDLEQYAQEIEQLTQWCVGALTTSVGQALVHNWVSFQLPHPIDHNHLVSIQAIPNDPFGRLEGPQHTRRQRQGFQLTDQRMSVQQIQNEIHYCIYCHSHNGDFCSKGFPQQKTEPERGLKTDPLGNILTGCPLTEKISEMQLLRRQGYLIASLAVVMIDNPMCPVTGHRICNDCMKACIYQKQEPVNIAQIETRVLTDVLELPWGVEIYDLLTRWNPLRQQQWVAKPYNGLKVLIAGQGPAGFTLAHHLLMEGFAVVGVDGLKIEPLPESLLKQPLRDYATLQEALDERIMTGFGGVAEYGITVRWDKNFLKLIYLNLLRRPYFQVYGNVRFGGTFTVTGAWALGFDHLAIAVGAGLPQALTIPGSLAPGMRQANDFLMALQLTGAAKATSLANLQVRLPAIVIGGGLTGIDTATEVQAYYLVQIDKIQQRYQQLIQTYGESQIREQLDTISLEILDEFLNHAQQLQTERTQAQATGTVPNIQGLLKQWGGVTVVYRRRLQDSPAYQRNHEEIIKALEEGIFYLEQVEPKAVRLDELGQVQFLVGQKCLSQAHASEEIVLPARSIFVATGAQPNIAYEFEHRGHFQRTSFQYQPYHDVAGQLQPLPIATHCKVNDFGPFTSYQHQEHRVTFIGDTHPSFQGSVVKAIASAQRTYPAIVKLFGELVHQRGDETEYLTFRDKMQYQFLVRLEQIHRCTPTITELKIRAPLVAQQFRPGQFFRLQNLATQATQVGNTQLQMEALALRCAGVDRDQGTLSLMVIENGASSRLCATLKLGEPLALMGPTGVRAKIYAGGETVMIIGGRLSMADIRTLGPALRNAGNRVLYLACLPSAADVYCQDELEAATDAIVWITEVGDPVTVHRSPDYAATGNLLDVLRNYATWQGSSDNQSSISWSEVTRVSVIGGPHFVATIAKAKTDIFDPYLTQSPPITVAVHGPMQCMLKGVCAQCLQWQIDPITKQRTKAVFACSWQDQPLEIVDIDHLVERSNQNRLPEQLSNLWLDYLFAHYEIERV